MKTKVRRYIIVGGLVWITALLFYIPSDRAFYQVNGGWDYSTVYSDVFDNAQKLQPYEAIAPEVCSEFNAEFAHGFKHRFRSVSPVTMTMTYKGQGRYQADFKSIGDGTLSLFEYFIHTTFASTYNRVATKHGLPALAADRLSYGGWFGDYLAGQRRWILVGTMFLSLFITIQVHRMLKRQETQ